MYAFTLVLVAAFFAMFASSQQPKALVYRGKNSCDGCPEAVANLLKSSPSKFQVKFAGPDEKIKITEATLSQVDVWAYPGGACEY